MWSINLFINNWFFENIHSINKNWLFIGIKNESISKRMYNKIWWE